MILRQLAQECKLCQQVDLPALQQVISTEQIRSAVLSCSKQVKRLRKLNAEAVVWVLIASQLFPHLSLGMVLEKITYVLRTLCPHAQEGLAGGSALTYRRYQLGVRPLAALFRAICKPMATPDTPGAFRFGLRLMAIDGHITNVPDTPENAAYFGRSETDRGQSAWPQVQGSYLCECGTHAVVDVGFWPYGTGEQKGATRLLRSVSEGMLVMWDRGLHSYERLEAARKRGAHILVRLPSNIKPEYRCRLEDGSYLVWLAHPDREKKRAGEGMLLRMVIYTLTDPERVGYQETHRLLTTLLDDKFAPALELIEGYHERWEEEILFDEIETHQQRPDTLLRSRKPVGVLQELYALLLAHYAVRFLMLAAAHKAHLDPDRISFVRTVQILEMNLPIWILADPQDLPAHYERLLADIARKPLPPRRARANPRVVKRKMSTFALKRSDRHRGANHLKPFKEVILLI
jgi:hypothetical protein